MIKPARPLTIVEHPAGFNPWDNNQTLIRMFAEAVRVSVNRQALRFADKAANHSETQDLTVTAQKGQTA